MESTSTTAAASNNPISISLLAKWGKERIEITALDPQATIGQVKSMITERTNVLPKRQKLIGLTTKSKVKVTDDTVLMDLKIKPSKSDKNEENVIYHSFILMGTAESNIFVDPSDREDLPDVVDDFDLDFNAGSDQWVEHAAKEINLKKFTEKTKILCMNEPRPKKPLLVLDLDHTLLDFSSKKLIAAAPDASTAGVTTSVPELISKMKRPYMDHFLANAYQHYDLCVWSQTSWRWLETKLTELGMLTHPGYKWCFVLDKSSMFSITSRTKKGKKMDHYVKPLQIIWSKFPGRWGEHNTVHLDDLARNFAMNLANGLKVTAYYRKKSSSARDIELQGLAQYLGQLAREVSDFRKVKFSQWREVLSGKIKLLQEDSNNGEIDESNAKAN